jgi:hypothetical protein
VAAVDAIERMGASGPLGGRLFTHEQYGGYLIYRLFPRVHVFVDGRYQLYGRSPIPDEMSEVMEAEPTWRAVLDRWKVDWVLVPRKAPAAHALAESPDWTRAYGDSTAVLFNRRPGAGS